MYKIIYSNHFKKNFKNLDWKEKKDTRTYIFNVLKYRGDRVGKPLSYYFFREKKIKSKRLYYLAYQDVRVIILLDVSHKKQQRDLINWAKKNLKKFRKIALEQSNN